VGAGRKPKPVAKKQSETVSAHLTPAELAELRRVAGPEPLGAFLRALILRALARRRRK
jgi:hypothetical protein